MYEYKITLPFSARVCITLAFQLNSWEVFTPSGLLDRQSHGDRCLPFSPPLRAHDNLGADKVHLAFPMLIPGAWIFIECALEYPG